MAPRVELTERVEQAEVFRRLVDLQTDGVEITSEHPLLQECGRCLPEALDLGRLVLHRSDEEGIDELWGEPFRLFSTSLEQFYEGRYIKIGQAMKDIDAISNCVVSNFGNIPVFAAINCIVLEFAAAARVKIETLRTDPGIFDVRARFVVAGERLANYSPVAIPAEAELKSSGRPRGVSDGVQLLRNGHALMFHITRARTSMPKGTHEFIERCEFYRLNGRCRQIPAPLPG